MESQQYQCIQLQRPQREIDRHTERGRQRQRQRQRERERERERERGRGGVIDGESAVPVHTTPASSACPQRC